MPSTKPRNPGHLRPQRPHRQPPAPPPPPPKPPKSAYGRGTTHYTPKSDLHTNAAFTEQEEFDFLMGERIIVGVPERSEWVQSAQWNPRALTITLWTDRGDEMGPYSGMDETQARIFAQANSKGGWYWAVVVGRGTVPTLAEAGLGAWSWRDPFGLAYQRKKKTFGQAGVTTPIAQMRQKKKAPAWKNMFRW